jgi:imidazolonepropionase-like amidohydrolase
VRPKGRFPGFSSFLHFNVNIFLLQEAGLTPAEVLVAATYGGAIALGVEDEIGTVEAGKLADMVVLRANPSANIRNARQIEWVIKGGVVFRPRDLLAGPEGEM